METTKKASKGYLETIGRRKTSSARVRLTPSAKTTYTINGKDIKVYFPTKELERIVREALETSKVEAHYEVSAKVQGGGIHAQAEAVRHGIARALVHNHEEVKTTVKKAGLLKRDARMKERRKFGLKKARKAPQWSKR